MSNQLTVSDFIPATFDAQIRGQLMVVDGIRVLPAESLTKIFEYGLQRILNDSTGAAGTDLAKAMVLAEKRWSSLVDGNIRQSGGRTSDPVRKRALELAENAIKKTAEFINWVKTEKPDAKAQAKLLRVEALGQLKVEGNVFERQAKIDVEGQKGLELSGLSLSFAKKAEPESEDSEDGDESEDIDASDIEPEDSEESEDE